VSLFVKDITADTSSGNAWIDGIVGDRALYPNWNLVTPQIDTINFTFEFGNDLALSRGITRGSQTRLNDNQIGAVRSVLDYISEATGIQFQETSSANAQLFFSNSDIVSGNSAWTQFTYRYGYNANQMLTSFQYEVHVYFDMIEYGSTNANPANGTFGYELILHEMGHVLGLKHPFEGDNLLTGSADSTANTLMSYNNSSPYHSTYSQFDIAALHYLYGQDGIGNSQGYFSDTNVVVGTSAAEDIQGSSRSDLFYPNAGNDRIYGKGGIDALVLADTSTKYQTQKSAGAWTVTRSTGISEQDTLLDVERIKFTDISLALDLDGNAGHVAKILGSVFGSASVGNQQYVGIGLSYADNGMGFEDLVSLALNARLGSTYSNGDLVNLLYTNVVGRAPDNATFAYFKEMLDSGSLTRAGLGALAAEHQLNTAAIDLVGLQTTGIKYIEFG
jgi:hypothetical protein